MIRFLCPRCRALLEKPENVAGDKFACPACGQKLQVPQPPPTPPQGKTVLGEILEYPSSTNPTHPQQPVPINPVVTPPQRPPSEPRSKPIPVSKPGSWSDDNWDDDDLPPPRRRRRSNRELRELPSQAEMARASLAGLICSISGLILLMVIFFLLIIMGRQMDDNQIHGFLIISMFGLIGAFVLTLLGVVYGSKGMSEYNHDNRGVGVAGLIFGIIGVVLSILGGGWLTCLGTLTRFRW
jgi:hypothetical protein